MSGDQIPSLPGKKRRQIPRVCPGGMLKLRFDWYIIYIQIEPKPTYLAEAWESAPAESFFWYAVNLVKRLKGGKNPAKYE